MNLRPENATRVDLYVDGQLGDPQRREFEVDLKTDPMLAGELELQQWIDQELVRQFEVPAIAPPAATAPSAPLKLNRTRSWTLRLAAAAVLGLVGMGVWLAMRGGAAGHAPTRLIPPEAVYARMEANGFKPEFVCTTDAEFQAAVQKRLGTPLAFEQTPGVQVVGWAYTGQFPGKVLGDKTLILLSTVGDAHPVVLMDQASADRPLSLPTGSPLHLFKRQVGPIVAYEITPLNEPRVIGQLRETRK